MGFTMIWLFFREEDWVNHKMDEGNFGPILVAAPKREAW